MHSFSRKALFFQAKFWFQLISIPSVEETVKTPDHILPQGHQMLKEAGIESSTPLSHHALQRHLGKSDVLGPSWAKAFYRPTTTVVFS